MLKAARKTFSKLIQNNDRISYQVMPLPEILTPDLPNQDMLPVLSPPHTLPKKTLQAVLYEPREISSSEYTTSLISLGVGGFGEVKLGYWAESNGTQLLALKKYSKQLEKKYFDDETDVYKMICKNGEHPNLVRVFGWNTAGLCKILVMEYVKGQGVDDWLEKNPRTDELNIQQARQIVMDLLKALIFIHSIGVIHFDIKPENLMLTNDQRTKLIDFNIAKLIPEGQDRLMLESGRGTMRWAPPEVLCKIYNRCVVSQLADIYSFGLVLFLCTSEKGFMVYPEIEDDTFNAAGRLRERILSRMLPFPVSESPSDTEALIVHCLKYVKEDRPKAQEVYDKLGALWKIR